jgi:hypothetical protein
VSSTRTPREKTAITISIAALVWVVGATMIYATGGINTSGLLPTIGCSIALWAAIKSDVRLMWWGTGIVLVSAVLLVFSLWLVVLPAAISLVVGSIVLASAATAVSR